MTVQTSSCFPTILIKWKILLYRMFILKEFSSYDSTHQGTCSLQVLLTKHLFLISLDTPEVIDVVENRCYMPNCHLSSSKTKKVSCRGRKSERVFTKILSLFKLKKEKVRKWGLFYVWTLIVYWLNGEWNFSLKLVSLICLLGWVFRYLQALGSIQFVSLIQTLAQKNIILKFPSPSFRAPARLFYEEVINKSFWIKFPYDKMEISLSSKVKNDFASCFSKFLLIAFLIVAVYPLTIAEVDNIIY